jgi:hypothetical protein
VNSLREIQGEFFAALLSGNTGPCTWLREDGIAAAERLQIYRNNTQLGFVTTLRATYPVIERLGGSDWFHQISLRYKERFPSRSGDLQYIGAHFSEFLRTEFTSTAFEYFIDIARLEWAYQEVLIAAEAAPFNPALLADVASGDYENVIFIPRPCVRIIASRFPLLAIWKANQPDTSTSPDTIDLDAGANRILLLRRDDGIELRELTLGQFALLEAFMSAQPLAVATNTAAMAANDFDLSVDLQQLLALQTIATCRVDTNV